MGFNSMGAKTVANHLRDAKKGLPEWFRVGVNLGKNKETPNENAATDYLDALQEFRDLVDFVVINVSSPNTPGLRALQEVETLRSLYQVVKTELSSWQNPSTPIWIKLAPELEGAALEELLKGVPADAWVLTNTLSGEWQNQKGGWSGRPLKELSRDRLRSAIKVTQTPMVSVGGILSVEEAKLRLELGAALIEIYSGWVFRGPFYPKKLRSGLQKK
jgi:dihydroorotate dehydrogenase